MTKMRMTETGDGMPGKLLDRIAMRKDSSIPERKSVRLEGFEYASGGAYLITVCTESKAPCFERYPELKAIVEVEWDSLPARFPSVTADVFVAMPNHVHGILILDQAGRATPYPEGRPLRSPASRSQGQGGRPQGSPLQWDGSWVLSNPCV